eukprot:SAG22_NODE_73_length_22318_cov_47.105315_20_plen_120_part_00
MPSELVTPATVAATVATTVVGQAERAEQPADLPPGETEVPLEGRQHPGPANPQREPAADGVHVVPAPLDVGLPQLLVVLQPRLRTLELGSDLLSASEPPRVSERHTHSKLTLLQDQPSS